jgi:hypothetical protein
LGDLAEDQGTGWSALAAWPSADIEREGHEHAERRRLNDDQAAQDRSDHRAIVIA